MNPEIESEALKCVRALREGSFIIFPAEIGWSIGCDAGHTENVKAIMESDNFRLGAIILDAPGRLNKYVKSIPDALWDLIEYTGKPLHLLPEDTINLPAVFNGENHQAVFRIVKDEFTLTVTSKFGKPVFAAVFASSEQPLKTNSILNNKCYMVNLRAGAKLNAGNLTVMKFSDNGKFEFITR